MSKKHLKIVIHELHNIYVRIAIEDIKLNQSDKKKYADIDSGKPAELNYVERIPFIKLQKKASKKNKDLLNKAFESFVGELDTENIDFDFDLYEPFYPKGRDARPYGPSELDRGQDIKSNLTLTHFKKILFISIFALLGTYFMFFSRHEDAIPNGVTMYVVAIFAYWVTYIDHIDKINQYKVKLHNYLNDVNIYCGTYTYKVTGLDNYGFTNPNKHREFKSICFSDQKVSTIKKISQELSGQRNKNIEKLHPGKNLSNSELDELIIKSIDKAIWDKSRK